MADLVSVLAESVYAHRGLPLFGTRSGAGAWSWMSYGEFAQRVDTLRGGLASLGIGPGSRVAVISRNRIEWAVGFYATVGLGAAYVPMYEAQSEREWRHVLSDSGAAACLISGASVGARATPATRGIDTLKHVVDFDAPAEDPAGYSALLAHGERQPTAPIKPRGEDLAELVYTSGTTGTPKGVRLTHTNIASNVDSVIRILPVSHEDRTLSFLPWAHVFGGDELHGMISLGASMALCDSVDRIAAELAEVQPTLLFAVPRVWNQVYQGVRQALTQQPSAVRRIFDRAVGAMHRRRAGERLSVADTIALAVAKTALFPKIRARFGGRLRLAVSAAAALAPEVAEFIDDLGIVVLEAYGLTESSACATINRPNERRIGSVGKPIPGVRVELDRDVQGAEGDTGEIVLYGHGIMAGYHNLPDETARTLTPDGGLRTGDLGRFDRDGFLFITGRIKELYKLENGKYVAPAAVEEQLTLSPFIEQAFVYGANRPHNVALIVPSRNALRAWAQSRERETQSLGALLGEPEVRILFEREVTQRSADLKGFERIQAFALIEEPFSSDGGLLTPTLKVKRLNVFERYKAQLEALYKPTHLGSGAPPAAVLSC
jgi:long-chain acyl-CoA synthetase